MRTPLSESRNLIILRSVSPLMNDAWQVWLISGGLFLILELFTPGFVAAVLGGACCLTAVPSALHAPFWVIVSTFIVATLGLTLGVRPFFVGRTGSVAARTNADALVGSTGRVLESIDNLSATGRVLVEGDDWRALSETNEPIAAGEMVLVKRIESNRLHVCRIS